MNAKSQFFFSTLVMLYFGSSIFFTAQKAHVFLKTSRSKSVRYLKARITGDYADPFASVKIEDPFTQKDSLRHLKLTISPRRLKTLDDKRKAALRINGLIASSDDYVPARAVFDGEKARVKLRLKGDMIDHLKGYKWSFRIKVRGNNTLAGMKVFSIQHPKTRKFTKEWLFHKLLKEHDIIALRYDFIKVSINDVYLGLYAMEEHFDKRLIEHNRFREGPILKFDESDLWKQIREANGNYQDDTIFLNADILSFQKNKLLKSPVQFSYFKKAAKSLDAFRTRKLPTHQVFDLNKWARYFVFSEVFGGKHGNRWHNMRFYYNPITTYIEPMGFDADCRNRWSYRASFLGLFAHYTYDKFSRILYADTTFFKTFMSNLNTVIDSQYFDNFLKRHKEELEKKNRLLHKEFPYFNYDPVAHIKGGQDYLRKVLSTPFHRNLKVYAYYSKNKGLQIAYRTVGEMPLSPVSLTSSTGTRYPLHTRIVKSLKQDVDHNLGYEEIPNFEALAPTDSLLCKFTIFGQSHIFSSTVIFDSAKVSQIREQIHNSEPVLYANSKDLPKQPSHFNHLDCFAYDTVQKLITITESCIISDHVIFPKGHRIRAVPGITINLRNKALLLSHSPLYFKGTEEKPITITSTDKTGQGIVVLNALDTSYFEHVTCSLLTNPDRDGWLLTGAVTFYQSPVSITASTFTHNNSEDGLNIVRSSFHIVDTRIGHAYSDAFDADFCTGAFENSSFYHSLNDAVDVSGSHVTITNLTINKAGDKGVSAGEKSEVYLRNVHIKNSQIGIASKDSSKVYANNVDITRSKIGLCLYQKKPEFGPSRIDISDLDVHNVDLPYLADKGCKINLEGKDISQLGRTKQDVLFKRIINGDKLN